jgi:aspartate/methionine/tyrosine aminotransferase
MRFAKFTDELTPFLAMEVMERGMQLAAQGHDIVQLAVGEPDFAPPPAVVEATTRALQDGHTHYTSSLGLGALREAIAEDCFARRGVRVSPERVLVTSGTSPALALVTRLLLEAGDELLMAAPYYPCYPNMAAVCDARAVLVPCAARDGYRIDVDRVRAAITPRTRAILIAAPANPTGAVQPPETIQALCQLGLPVLSDEIYDGLLYGTARVTSPLGLSDECFVFDGFSKRYAMTGFRLGYVIAPDAAMRTLRSLHQNLHISASDFVQHAGLAALAHGAEHVAHMRDAYARRRDLLVAGLARLGLGVQHAPDGAFYVLADARALGQDSLAVALALLERAHVAAGPGRDFGAVAEGHLRFSFCRSEAQLREGLQRLERALDGWAPV